MFDNFIHLYNNYDIIKLNFFFSVKKDNLNFDNHSFLVTLKKIKHIKAFLRGLLSLQALSLHANTLQYGAGRSCFF